MTLGLLSLMVVVGVVMTVGAKRQARTIIAERLRDLSMDVTEWRESIKRFREVTNAAALVRNDTNTTCRVRGRVAPAAASRWKIT